MKMMWILSVAVLYAGAVCAGEGVPPFLKATWDTSRLRQDFQGRAADMMLSSWLSDRTRNEGKGNSDATTSGGLAWGESSYLMDYIMCYQAFGDTYWLDKVVDHFDRMLGSLSDPEHSGFLAWRDRGYSVGIVSTKLKKNTDGLTIEPETSRQWAGRDGEKVTGHDYSVTFPTPDSIEVRDETEKKTVATKAYKDKLVLTDIPGSKFTISGAAKPGARFDFASTPIEEIQYKVHDGMITYPIAQFIEIVFKDPGLHDKYKKKADQYLAFIDKNIRQKWESTWVELPDNCGAYIFTKNLTQRFPGGLLPHNQFLAPARTYIVLMDVAGVPNREVYLEKATKMAKYFKKNLRLNGSAYVWNYWDPYPPIAEVRLNIEDTSHGTIDIGFAVEACNRGVVFTVEDLRRFSNAYADVMWNQSRDDPVISGVVDGRKTKRDGGITSQWMKLAQWNPKVWDIVTLIQKKSPSSGQVPGILSMVAGLAGMEASEIQRFNMLRAQMEQGLSSGIPINGDFELGNQADQLPYGWTFGVWSRSEGKGQWVEGGYNSKHCIMLEGIGGSVNVVASPVVRTRVDKPTKFRMSVYYRTEGEARPYFSFLGSEQYGGTAKQYVSLPVLPRSAEWQKAEWEATSAEGIKEVYFALRNGGIGKVFYDGFHMEREE